MYLVKDTLVDVSPACLRSAIVTTCLLYIYVLILYEDVYLPYGYMSHTVKYCK